MAASTIAERLSVQEASFLVFRIQPCSTNISKRLVRSPKIYFAEVGFASWLLGIETPNKAPAIPCAASS